MAAHDRGWPRAELAGDGREILVATLSGTHRAYPVSTEGGFSAGQPTVVMRDSAMRRDSARPCAITPSILIRVSPDAAKDKGEIQFGWADAWLQGRR